MSNITNSSKKSLLEFLQYQTKDSFLQNNYSTSNQNLLEFISNIFLKNLTEDQEKKLLKLGELSIEKQRIDKEIAKIQNPSNKTDELSSEKIKLDYFNGLRDICVQVFEKDHEIFNQINEAEQNLIFENLFMKDKANENAKEVFTKEELNSKYGLGIAYFNNKIWKEISDSDKFKNLGQDKQDELDKSSLRILSKLRLDSTKFKTQNKKNETEQLKALEELEKENDKIVQEINKINEELDPNITKEEAEKILKEIFSKIKIIQNKYNILSDEEKQKIKVSYREMLCNQIGCNQIDDGIFVKFFKNLKQESGIDNEDRYSKIIENQDPNNKTNSFIKNLLLSFIQPINSFEKIEHAVNFSNSNFREQLIFALKQVASFYGIEDYKDFELNFDFIKNDQINQDFRAYKHNKIKLDQDHSMQILIPQEYIENDEKFHKLEKNPKILEGFKPTESKIEIFKEFGFQDKMLFGNSLLFGKFCNIEIIRYLLLSYQRKDLLEDLYNLPDEKLKIISKFKGAFVTAIIYLQINNLSEEESESILKFKEDFITVIDNLNKDNLLNKFFDIIKKSNDLSEIEKMANDIQDKRGDTLCEYIENIVIKYVKDYKFANQSNQENNLELKNVSPVNQEQENVISQNNL